MSEREGLIARIRQIRRSTRAAQSRPVAGTETNPDALGALAERVSHLEQLVEGLQDSVHREALRNGKRIADLEARIQPAALSKALSQDRRERGI